MTSSERHTFDFNDKAILFKCSRVSETIEDNGTMINNMIGRKLKDNSVARAARTLVHFSALIVKLCN